jgi:TPR repeat protein
MLTTVLTLRSADGLHELACELGSSIDLGSALECEIVLDGGATLPRHCVLRRSGERRFQISRAVPEARFTVNGVTAPELEVETPFQFGIGDEVITFDLTAEGELLPELPAWNEPEPPLVGTEARSSALPEEPPQAAQRPSRRDYLMQPTVLRQRVGERLGEVLLDVPLAAPLVVEEPAPAPPSEAIQDIQKTETTAERDASFPLRFACLVPCVLLTAAVFFWRHDDRQRMQMDDGEAGQTVLLTPCSVPERVLQSAMSLRLAGAAMLSAQLVMPLAESGETRATQELALALLASREFSEEALFLLRQAAEGGIRTALTDLADAVENPLNMARYGAESFQHLEFAARLGESAAWMPLGERLEQGLGVEKNLQRALEAYEKAQAAGDRRAAAKLAAKREALERVAAFLRSWNEVSVASLLDHVSSSSERYFGHEKPPIEALLRSEEQLRLLWPLRRVSLGGDAVVSPRSFERMEVTQSFQFELQRGERIARGSGVLMCVVAREEGGWRVVSAQDEIALKELLPAADQFVTASSLRALKPAFSRVEQVEEVRLEILEKMRGIEQTQDFKPALSLILDAMTAFPQEVFWRPFADKLCDRMAREFFMKGRWLDAAWSAPVRQLAATGSVSAMLLEGHLLMAGYGFSRDEKRGLTLYQQAFEVGKRRDARFYFAEALFQGNGTPQDLPKAGALALSFMMRSKHPLEAYLAAHLLWRKAEIDPSLWQDVYDTLSRVAEKHPPAKHLAAMVLLNHGNTTRERKTGFMALKAAAEAGVLEAMKNLSKCYQDGVGCEKDFQAATLWKQKAAVTVPLRRRHYTEFEE